MSIHCMNRVWEHSGQSGSARLLLIALADYADENGFAWPGLETLARKTLLSSRHLSRLVARLQAAGELLVLRRRGRSHLYVVLSGARAHHLDAALQRAEDHGAAVDGLFDATLDRLPKTGASLSRARAASPGAATPDTGSPHAGGLAVTPDNASSRSGDVSPTPDTASPRTPDISSPTPDKLSRTPDKLSRTPDKLSGTPDIAMSSDPLGSGIDPSVEGKWSTFLKALSGQMTRATFEHRLGGSRVVHVEGNVWTVQIPIPLALDWIEHRLDRVIRRNLEFHLPGIQLRFVARGSTRTVCIAPAGRAGTPVHAPVPAAMPVAAPAPVAAPEPVPEPIPAPVPVSAAMPVAAPVATPEPAPEPAPERVPEPASEAAPAAVPRLLSFVLRRSSAIAQTPSFAHRPSSAVARPLSTLPRPPPGLWASKSKCSYKMREGLHAGRGSPDRATMGEGPQGPPASATASTPLRVLVAGVAVVSRPSTQTEPVRSRPVSSSRIAPRSETFGERGRSYSKRYRQ